MRTAELTGRAGKQPDGSAKTRAVELVTVWTAEGRDPDGGPVCDRGSVTYSAALESAASPNAVTAPSAFAQRADREARRRGFDHAQRRVVLGDGAAWIWQLADDLFYGAGTAFSRPWAPLRHDELDAGHLRALCAALRQHASTHSEARRCRGYVTQHRARLRDPTFRAQGLCVSSGVAEAGCKVAIGTRLERTGMPWTVAGAGAIIALRCCRLSGRFEDFWERRAARREAACPALISQV
jgi:hypothetical protein